MVKAYCLGDLKRVFRNAAGNNRRKLFEKKENGIRFIFDRRSFNKIGCDKSINNSVVRGFTPQEHFKAAENIRDLFLYSEVVGQWYKKKKARAETYYLCRCKIRDDCYAWMRVTTWGKDEGYIDMYLSKDGE
jgi:hypothetical protein